MKPIKTEFYVINDYISGAYLTEYSPNLGYDVDCLEWDGDNCLDYGDISPIGMSARFPTKEAACDALEWVRNYFKHHGEADLNFGILFVEAETKVVEQTTIKKREV